MNSAERDDTISQVLLERRDKAAGLFEAIVAQQPRLVSAILPSNGPEAKKQFLASDADAPDNTYTTLEGYDFAARTEALKDIASQIDDDVDKPVYAAAYAGTLDRYTKMTAMLESAVAVKHDDSPESRNDFMELNIELYGKPEASVYHSLLHDKLAAIDAKDLSESAQAIRAELQDRLGEAEHEAGETRFVPSQETIEWMHTVVESLYENLLRHVPEDQETFDAAAIQNVFTDIIREEFGEAAADWRVDVEDAQSVNVKASEKRIVIPRERQVSRDKLRKLVVHEVGVHMLRAVMGEDTDLPILGIEVGGATDSEEGLGMVMEQALDGKYSEAGTDHYLTAGLAYYEHMNFRQVFEVKWRLKALSTYKSGDIDDKAITKAQDFAYTQAMRSFRSTDALPLFKDLAYYNGARDIWRHIESIAGDDLALSLMLLGKIDPTKNADQRLILESSSV